MRPPRNSPSNFIPSALQKTPWPWNQPCISSPSYLQTSGNAKGNARMPSDAGGQRVANERLTYLAPSGKIMTPMPEHMPSLKPPS